MSASPETRETTANEDLVLIPVSIGELIDKITILEIKEVRIQDGEKRRNVRKELALLRRDLSRHIPRTRDVLHSIQQQLRVVNEQLWEIEDQIREYERQKRFDADFVKLARSVYWTNDRRAALKRQANLVTGSALREEKSYTAY